MSYLHIKSLHIIFVVTWFAGLFYMVRLFVYHLEAGHKEEPEKSILTKQFGLMEKRLWYGITWPSALLSWFFGLTLWHMNSVLMEMTWFKVKLMMVCLLSLYHISCHFLYKSLQKGIIKFNAQHMRLWNEVATLFLVSIVFLVELQQTADMLKGILGLILFAMILLFAIRIYKKTRKD